MKKFRACIQLQCQPQVLRFEQQQPLFQKAYVEYQLCVQNGISHLGLDSISQSSESTLTQLQSNESKITAILNQCAKNVHTGLDEIDQYMNCQVQCLDQAVQEVQRISSSMSIGMIILITILIFAVISMTVFYVLYRYHKSNALKKMILADEEGQKQQFPQEEQLKESAKIAAQYGQSFKGSQQGRPIRIVLPSPQRRNHPKILLGGLSRLDVNKMKRIVDNLKIIHPSFEAMETDPHSQQTQDSHSASFDLQQQQHKELSRPISITNEAIKKNIHEKELNEEHSTDKIVNLTVPTSYFQYNNNGCEEEDEKLSQSEITTAVFGDENLKKNSKTWSIKKNNIYNKLTDKKSKKRCSASVVDGNTYNVNQSINSQVPLIVDPKEDSLADHNNNDNNNTLPQLSSHRNQFKAKSLHILLSPNEINESLEIHNKLYRRRDSLSNQKSNRFSDFLDNSLSPSSVRSYMNNTNMLTASPVNSTNNDTQTQLNMPSPSQPTLRQNQQQLFPKKKLFTTTNRYSIYSPKSRINTMESPEIKRNSLKTKKSFDQPSFGYQFHLQTEHASPTKYFTPKNSKTQPEEQAIIGKIRGELLAKETGGYNKSNGIPLIQVVSIPSITQLHLDSSLDYSSSKGQLITAEKEQTNQKTNESLSMIDMNLESQKVKQGVQNP